MYVCMYVCMYTSTMAKEEAPTSKGEENHL